MLGHKTRSVLNTSKIFDIAIEIATIKKFLSNLDKNPNQGTKQFLILIRTF